MDETAAERRMDGRAAERRIVGWYFFDWASQPYGTLVLTFIFAPYLQELVGAGDRAQAAWGYGMAAAGVVVALLAPLLGGVADRAGPLARLQMIWLFSALCIVASLGLWTAAPGDFSLIAALVWAGLGLIGLELATIFSNAMLPGLAPRARIGRLSGNGWALGYAGGLTALVAMLALFAEDAESGRTMIGIAPVLGLDPAMREGTRAVGPFTALWYAVFMLPFFLWVREVRPTGAMRLGPALRHAWPDLRATLAGLPSRPSLSAFLISSMFYRDALNGLYFFGGIYTAGVLGWSVVDVGLFGILAVLSGAVFAWIGGHADARFGPKPVVRAAIWVLIAATLAAIFIARDRVFGIAVAEGSALPDVAFYIVGATIGAAGGVLQAASRTLMADQVALHEATQGFGLYALAGKATAFLAPFLVAVVTDVTGSQQAGIVPLLGLFLVGVVLLGWVRADGDRPR